MMRVWYQTSTYAKQGKWFYLKMRGLPAKTISTVLLQFLHTECLTYSTLTWSSSLNISLPSYLFFVESNRAVVFFVDI